MLLPLLVSATVLQGSKDIDAYTTRGLRDLTLNLTVETKRLPELRKIGPEFAQTYLFDTILVRAKEPFKLRFDAAADDTKAVYLMDGTRQQFRVPRLGLNQSHDLAKYPGRRQTILEFALVPPSLVQDFFQATFVRFDRETGDPVFDFRFSPSTKDTSRNRVWIDKAKHYVVRREWYGQEDQLRATFTYDKPIQTSGVWLPTRLSVRNSEDKVGGVVRYGGIKVNTILPDSVFKL